VPLHDAAFYNSAACIQVLLDCGAPLRPRTAQGKTPLQIAEEVKSDEAIFILRQHKVLPAKSLRIDWLHDQSKFDRIAAKQLMESVKTGPVNGMFTVRHSSNSPMNYALTLYKDNDVFNFEIVCLNESTYYIDDGPYMDSLEHLIDHYCRIPDGLPTTLTCSINQSREVVRSRVQPFITSHTNNKIRGK
jgi:tyrosine-protein kinase